MKLTSSLLTAVSAALVSAGAGMLNCPIGSGCPGSEPAKFSLQVQCAFNGSIDGMYVSPYHEGAGINYAFIAGTTSTENFQLNDTVLTTSYWDNLDQAALILSGGSGVPVLEIGVLPEPGTDHWQTGYSVDKNFLLAVNGSSTGFYACHNIGDPYNYPEPAIVFYGTAQPASTVTCQAIQLAVKYFTSAPTSTASVNPGGPIISATSPVIAAVAAPPATTPAIVFDPVSSP